MPADSLAEAILRELGAFGKDVGRQIGTNEEINRQRNFENQSRQFDFDVEQGRQADITARSDRDFGLRQQKYDLDLATRNPVSKRILDAISGAQQPPPMKDQLSNMFATDRPAYYEHERIMEDIKNRGKTPTSKEPPDYASQIMEEFNARKTQQGKRSKDFYGTAGNVYMSPEGETIQKPFPEESVTLADVFKSKSPYIEKMLGEGAGDSVAQVLGLPTGAARKATLEDVTSGIQRLQGLQGLQGEESTRPMPAGWPGTQEQWLDYLRRKAAQE